MHVVPKPVVLKTDKGSAMLSINHWLAIVFAWLSLMLVKIDPVSAQDTQAHSLKYMLRAGPALNKHYAIDKNFSALTYSGTMAGAYLGINATAKKAIHDLSTYFTKGPLNTPGTSASKANAYYLRLDYALLYPLRINRGSNLQWFAGGALNYLYVKREFTDFINNKNSFESTLAMGAGIKAVYTSKENLGGLLISAQLFSPVLGLLLQPSYGSQEISGTDNNTSTASIVKANRLVSFSDYLRLTGGLGVGKFIGNHSSLSAACTFDYYHITTSREVKSESIILSIGYQLVF